MSAVQDISEAIAASLGAGTVIGHFSSSIWSRREHKKDILQGLVWAVGGKPPTNLGPRQPGLVDAVKELAEQMTVIRDRLERHESWHERQEVSIER